MTSATDVPGTEEPSAVGPHWGSESTPEQILAEARRLGEDFALRAAEHDRAGSFAFENVEALHAAGLLRLTMPPAEGGLGAGLETSCRVVQAIAEGDPSTALIVASPAW